MPSEHPNNERRRACAMGSRSHSRIKRAVGSELWFGAMSSARPRDHEVSSRAGGMLRAGGQRVARCTQRHDAAAPARQPLGLPHPHVARPTVGGPHEDVALDCVLARRSIRVRRARLRPHLEQPQRCSSRLQRSAATATPPAEPIVATAHAARPHALLRPPSRPGPTSTIFVIPITKIVAGVPRIGRAWLTFR